MFKVLSILDDYLTDIVLGGGFVPLIYYQYLLGDKSATPLLTSDVDLLVKKGIPVKRGKSINTLLEEAGFKGKLFGYGSKPVVHYSGNFDEDEIIIEFLTDLKGKGDIKVIEVQEGLNAEALRYITISFENTINVHIDDLKDYGFIKDLTVTVPTPGAYIFHKGLSFPLRKDKMKIEKDLYYIFDLIRHKELNLRIVKEMNILKEQYIPWFKKLQRNLHDYFISDSDGFPKGVFSVYNQKPTDLFNDMTSDQLKNYIKFNFDEFIGKIT